MEAARHAYEAVGLRPAQRFPTRPFVTVAVVTEAGAPGLFKVCDLHKRSMFDSVDLLLQSWFFVKNLQG